MGFGVCLHAKLACSADVGSDSAELLLVRLRHAIRWIGEQGGVWIAFVKDKVKGTMKNSVRSYQKRELTTMTLKSKGEVRFEALVCSVILQPPRKSLRIFYQPNAPQRPQPNQRLDSHSHDKYLPLAAINHNDHPSRAFLAPIRDSSMSYTRPDLPTGSPSRHWRRWTFDPTWPIASSSA